MLAEDIELSLKMLRIKGTVLTRISVAVMRSKHDERLKYERFFAAGCWAKNGAVGGDFSPTENAQPQLGGYLGKNALLPLKFDRIIRLEKDVADRVLLWLRKDTTDVPLSLSFEKEVGYTGHDAGTIPISTVSASRTAMGHGTQKLPCIRNYLVAWVAFNVADKAYSATVFVVLVIV